MSLLRLWGKRGEREREREKEREREREKEREREFVGVFSGKAIQADRSGHISATLPQTRGVYFNEAVIRNIN